MKKKFVLSLALILVLLFSTVLGTATGYSQKITAWFYDIRINLDSKPLGFYSSPFIYNGQVYVSINDLANNMGFGIQWDNKNKTMNLSSNDNNRFTVNTLQHELDQKNMEIANLKFQLSQKKVELDILRDNKTTSSTTRKNLNDLEKKLEDDYDYHRNNGRTLNFDNYDVSQLSNNKIRVGMYGDFDRTGKHWKDRDKSDFEDFIEKICEKIDRDYDDDIEVIVYDEDNDKTAEYTYDISRDKLSEEYIYGNSSSSNDDLDDLEDDLERHFDDYRDDNSGTMKFTRYDLKEYSDEIRVTIKTDFDRNDDIWDDRDKSDFRNFIEDICEKVDKDYNKDIKVYVHDKDDDKLAEYTYDDGDNKIKNTYDWEYDK
ncbi:stalk domain-containing protein [Crassaminicella profunda]|uniref:stalk domain-containing protein n=1 Tax=Crassaminicella profunda TaxID=1286698 RepID=UPI001CA67FD3|nr:stalk domain-containing protein [Crassaminicella profunda]QZY55481.1 copper amine oxidase N-terminal domain-containing protein [Crassaminicella profunda]